MAIVANNYKTIKASSDGDSNSKSEEMDTEKCNIYQHPFLIVAGSLLVLLFFVAVAGHSGGWQYLTSSVDEIAEGAVVLADYQVDTDNLELTKDMFSMSAVSKNKVECSNTCKCKKSGCHCGASWGCCRC
mmetsp:Transcript_39161/g.43821  ORF Transcript_39161/g.43821 Transcript_39161/m.43821 type:complete len:130 (-) Transcript_39161:92-481(-)